MNNFMKPLFFQALHVSVNSGFLLVSSFPGVLTLGSTENIHIRADFAIPLSTEEGMFNVTGAVICNLSEFHWYSKYCCSCFPSISYIFNEIFFFRTNLSKTFVMQNSFCKTVSTKCPVTITSEFKSLVTFSSFS